MEGSKRWRSGGGRRAGEAAFSWRRRTGRRRQSRLLLLPAGSTAQFIPEGFSRKEGSQARTTRPEEKYEYIIMRKEKGKNGKKKPITWESEFYRPPAPPLRRMRSFQIRRNPGCQRPNRLLLASPWRSRLLFGRYPRRFDYYRNFLLLKKTNKKDY